MKERQIAYLTRRIAKLPLPKDLNGAIERFAEEKRLKDQITALEQQLAAWQRVRESIVVIDGGKK